MSSVKVVVTLVLLVVIVTVQCRFIRTSEYQPLNQKTILEKQYNLDVEDSKISASETLLSEEGRRIKKAATTLSPKLPNIESRNIISNGKCPKGFKMTGGFCFKEDEDY